MIWKLYFLLFIYSLILCIKKPDEFGACFFIQPISPFIIVAFPAINFLYKNGIISLNHTDDFVIIFYFFILGLILLPELVTFRNKKLQKIANEIPIYTKYILCIYIFTVIILNIGFLLNAKICSYCGLNFY